VQSRRHRLLKQMRRAEGHQQPAAVCALDEYEHEAKQERERKKKAHTPSQDCLLILLLRLRQPRLCVLLELLKNRILTLLQVLLMVREHRALDELGHREPIVREDRRHQIEVVIVVLVLLDRQEGYAQ
jgi:hypothetical protein